MNPFLGHFKKISFRSVTNFVFWLTLFNFSRKFPQIKPISSRTNYKFFEFWMSFEAFQHDSDKKRCRNSFQILMFCMDEHKNPRITMADQSKTLDQWFERCKSFQIINVNTFWANIECTSSKMDGKHISIFIVQTSWSALKTYVDLYTFDKVRLVHARDHFFLYNLEFDRLHWGMIGCSASSQPICLLTEQNKNS